MSKSAFTQHPTYRAYSGAIGFVYYSNTNVITIPGDPTRASLYKYGDTGLEITITPKFPTSSIILKSTISTNAGSQNSHIFRFYRSSPNNEGPISVGNERGHLARVGTKIFTRNYVTGLTIAMNGIDYADTILPITYKIQTSRWINDAYINANSVSGTLVHGISQIIAIEVGNLNG